MKFRRAYFILDILAAACFAGAHYLVEFAKTKLGFIRWLNFTGNKIAQDFPLGKIKFILLATVLLLVVVAVMLTLRRRSSAGLNGILMCAVTVAAAVYYAYASVAFDYSYSQAYFLVVPAVALGTLLLALRTIIPQPAKAEKTASETTVTTAD